MRLVRLRVDGFGALRGEYGFAPGRAMLIVDDNERGKSTLLEAITAALYGLSDDRRSHRLLTPLERWRPWTGADYRVELELESGGRRLTIVRRFDRGTIEVWDDRGAEITAEFREGRDEFPVGRRLLGLDAAEFEKCVLVRQGDLGDVVPADERQRRSSTLRARLENAADSRAGDANASDAVRVLETALRRFACREIDFTGTAENAVSRLELRCAALDTEIAALEHESARIAGPLEALARMDDEEQALRARRAALEDERRAALAAGIRRQLAADAEARAEADALRAEARELAAAAHVPATAEVDLREALARLEETERTRRALEDERAPALAAERDGIERELAALGAAADRAAEDADRCIAQAAALRRLAAEDRDQRTTLFRLREEMAARGFEPARAQWLTERIAGLGDEVQGLLRGQGEFAMRFQTDGARLEQTAAESVAALRAIDGQRLRRRVPAVALLLAGAGAMAAGAWVLGGEPLRTLLGAPPPVAVGAVAGGALLMLAALVVLLRAARLRARERGEALRRLGEAQGRLHRMREEHTEARLRLDELAGARGYRDAVQLLQEWTEHQRLLDNSAPLRAAQERLAAIEGERAAVEAAARSLLAEPGEAAVAPEALEQAAAAMRRAQALRGRWDDLDRDAARLAEEVRAATAAATGIRDRAVRILQASGLAHDPQRSWVEHAHDLAARVRERARHETLVRELLPQAERRQLPATRVAELESQLALIAAERRPGTPEPEAEPRSPAEVEVEVRQCQEALERLRRQATELRVKVESDWRRYTHEHPVRVAERQAVDRELGRVRRYQRALEIARDSIRTVADETHRRWAEHLNRRVPEILAGFGTRVQQLRFGDDLDFAVRLWNGLQLARGKADLQLSAGARDQLFLAVRLAIGEYLSRGGEPLPLLLDDPFATSDDERTGVAMRLLLEHFAPSHQVILLTCHRGRHRRLAELDPALYAERAQWLDLGAAALPAAEPQR